MATSLVEPVAASRPPLGILPQICKLCGTEQDAAPIAICDKCLGPLEPRYPKDRVLPGREEIARRAPNLWRYREWLPFIGEPAYSRDTGFTPLIDAPRLAAHLGVGRVWIKNDAVSQPTLSFKDRVVSVAIAKAREFGFEAMACASTGNLANSVAAHAAEAERQRPRACDQLRLSDQGRAAFARREQPASAEAAVDRARSSGDGEDEQRPASRRPREGIQAAD